MWYLIASIPDLCTLTYFEYQAYFAKNDELRITLGTDNGPDILGLCETFLDKAINNEQLYTNK